MAEYSDIINGVDSSLESFEREALKAQKRIMEKIQLLVKDLEVDSAGNIKTTIANLNKINTIKAEISKIVCDDRYRDAVTKFCESFEKVYNRQQKFYKEHFQEATISETAAKKQKLLRKMAVDNTIEGLTGAGINAQITDKLSEMLTRSVTSGALWTDMVAEMKAYLDPAGDGTGAFLKYAKTYATTAMGQFTGQNNKLMTDALDTEWYMYVGSDIETTREFCQHLTKKKYVHVSEIPEILKGHIDGHECAIYAKTGLPQGMIEGTTPENFQVNVGGWNCRHQLIPVAEEAVPQDVRDRFKGKKPVIEKKEEPIVEKEEKHIVKNESLQKSDMKIKNIAEAEEFLRQHMLNDSKFTFYGKKQLSLAGLSVETAKDVVDAICDVFEAFNLERFNGILALDPKSAQAKKFGIAEGAMASYTPITGGLQLNREILKNEAAYIAHRKGGKEAWEYLEKNIEKLSPSQRELFDRYKKSGRDLIGETIKDEIYHELGHALLTSLPTDVKRKLVEGMKDYAIKISGYAGANAEEYLAESFCAYMMGKRDLLDPKVAEYFDSIRKNPPAEQPAQKKNLFTPISVKTAEDVKRWNENIAAIEKNIGLPVEEPMSYDDADRGNCNPKYNEGREYHDNCQTCTMTYYMRRFLGIDVQAKPNGAFGRQKGQIWEILEKNGVDWKQRFLNLDGSAPNYDFSYIWKYRKGIKSLTKAKKLEYIREHMPEDGTYEVYCTWKGGSAHVFLAVRENGKIRLFDTQTGEQNVMSYVDRMKDIGIIRIDDKMINPKVMECFTK